MCVYVGVRGCMHMYMYVYVCARVLCPYVSDHLVHEQIRRFEISVNDALVMQPIQPVRNIQNLSG
jgi:hypothetical protein